MPVHSVNSLASLPFQLKAATGEDPPPAERVQPPNELPATFDDALNALVSNIVGSIDPTTGKVGTYEKSALGEYFQNAMRLKLREQLNAKAPISLQDAFNEVNDGVNSRLGGAASARNHNAGDVEASYKKYREEEGGKGHSAGQAHEAYQKFLTEDNPYKEPIDNHTQYEGARDAIAARLMGSVMIDPHAWTGLMNKEIGALYKNMMKFKLKVHSNNLEEAKKEVDNDVLGWLDGAGWAINNHHNLGLPGNNPGALLWIIKQVYWNENGGAGDADTLAKEAQKELKEGGSPAPEGWTFKRDYAGEADAAVAKVKYDLEAKKVTSTFTDADIKPHVMNMFLNKLIEYGRRDSTDDELKQMVKDVDYDLWERFKARLHNEVQDSDTYHIIQNDYGDYVHKRGGWQDLETLRATALAEFKAHTDKYLGQVEPRGTKEPPLPPPSVEELRRAVGAGDQNVAADLIRRGADAGAGMWGGEKDISIFMHAVVGGQREVVDVALKNPFWQSGIDYDAMLRSAAVFAANARYEDKYWSVSDPYFFTAQLESMLQHLLTRQLQESPLVGKDDLTGLAQRAKVKLLGDLRTRLSEILSEDVKLTEDKRKEKLKWWDEFFEGKHGDVNGRTGADIINRGIDSALKKVHERWNELLNKRWARDNNAMHAAGFRAGVTRDPGDQQFYDSLVKKGGDESILNSDGLTPPELLKKVKELLENAPKTEKRAGPYGSMNIGDMFGRYTVENVSLEETIRRAQLRRQVLEEAVHFVRTAGLTAHDLPIWYNWNHQDQPGRQNPQIRIGNWFIRDTNPTHDTTQQMEFLRDRLIDLRLFTNVLSNGDLDDSRNRRVLPQTRMERFRRALSAYVVIEEGRDMATFSDNGTRIPIDPLNRFVPTWLALGRGLIRVEQRVRMTDDELRAAVVVGPGSFPGGVGLWTARRHLQAIGLGRWANDIFTENDLRHHAPDGPMARRRFERDPVSELNPDGTYATVRDADPADPYGLELEPPLDLPQTGNWQLLIF